MKPEALIKSEGVFTVFRLIAEEEVISFRKISTDTYMQFLKRSYA